MVVVVSDEVVDEVVESVVVEEELDDSVVCAGVSTAQKITASVKQKANLPFNLQMDCSIAVSSLLCEVVRTLR